MCVEVITLRVWSKVQVKTAKKFLLLVLTIRHHRPIIFFVSFVCLANKRSALWGCIYECVTEVEFSGETECL